jgi:hypothetical protein
MVGPLGPDGAILRHTHRGDHRRRKTRFINTPQAYVGDAAHFDPSLIIDVPND